MSGSNSSAVLSAAKRSGGVGRWTLIVLLLVCVAPVLASYFVYYLVRPEARRNFGELIEPQRPLPAVVGTGLDGRSSMLTALRGQWLLVSVAGGACERRCRAHLYLQHQLRESLGKERDRVDWVWLISDQAPVGDTLVPALRTATVLRVAPDAVASWLIPAAGSQLSDHLYLVDPMGNWMLRFPAGLDLVDAPALRRDLDRLLRASASWDQAGRSAALGVQP